MNITLNTFHQSGNYDGITHLKKPKANFLRWDPVTKRKKKIQKPCKRKLTKLLVAEVHKNKIFPRQCLILILFGIEKKKAMGGGVGIRM